MFRWTAATMLALMGAPAAAQVAPPADTPPSQTVVDAARDRSARMTVPVSIDGHGPFAFVVDTGADRTVVSRELATELSLAEGLSATMHSMTGVGSVATVVVTGLDVGGGRTTDARRPDIHAPALAQAHLGAQGLLGVDALQGRRVVMDFRRDTFTITDARERERVTSDTIVVTARSRYGQLVLVDSDIAGTPITVIIDTGAQNSIGNFALRDMLIKRRKVGAFAKVELFDVTGTGFVAEAALVDGVRIGGIKINSLDVTFYDAHPFARFGLGTKPAMLLGMDTLRHFRRVSVDFAQRKVRFLLPGEV